MKAKVLLVLILIISFLTTGCSFGQATDVEDGADDYEKVMSFIEKELNELMEKYDNTEKEHKKELEALRSEVEKLAKEEISTIPEEIPEKNKFTYTLEGDMLILEGFTGDEDRLVIPSHIDAHPIKKIAEKAFASSKLTSVIISEGVEEIDWFCFYGSTELTSITIPPSVTKIGYSAFEGCSQALIIYCQKGSYAHDYAESYGISFVLI